MDATFQDDVWGKLLVDLSNRRIYKVAGTRTICRVTEGIATNESHLSKL